MAHIRDEMRAWVHSATLLIRFKPDRDAVAQELLEHIEDKALDIQRIFPDMTEREAMQRALDGMGDPYEIGRELSKIHKPWLGYLWRISQCLLVIAFAMVVAGFLRHEIDYAIHMAQDTYESWQEYLQDERALFGDEVPEGSRRLARYNLKAEARQGNCTILVPRAALYQNQEESPSLYIEVRLEYDYPWEKSDIPFYYLWAEDDFGNQYMIDAGYRSAAELSGLTWAYRCFILDNFPKEAKQLKFHYLPGTDFELCVDLTREVIG